MIAYIKKVIIAVKEFQPDPMASYAMTYVRTEEQKNIWLKACNKYGKKIFITII